MAADNVNDGFYFVEYNLIGGPRNGKWTRVACVKRLCKRVAGVLKSFAKKREKNTITRND